MKATESITIKSSDEKFLVKLINWLKEQEVEKDSTTIILHSWENGEILNKYHETNNNHNT